MNLLFRVCWKKRDNGSTSPDGFGDWQQDIDICSAWSAQMNKEYPRLTHWVETARVVGDEDSKEPFGTPLADHA